VLGTYLFAQATFDVTKNKKKKKKTQLIFYQQNIYNPIYFRKYHSPNRQILFSLRDDQYTCHFIYVA
jgi:uncharacterized membrane protein